MTSFGRLLSHRRHRIFFFLALLPIVALVACEIAGWPFLRAPAELLLDRQMARQVRLEAPFRLRFLGGVHLEVGGLWIAAPPEFDTPHFLDARNIDLKLRYGDLWDLKRSGDLRVASLLVGQMDVRLLRHADGDATWQFTKRSPQEAPPKLPAVDFLAVRQGRLLFRDPGLDADLQATFEAREGAAGATPVSHMEVEGQFRKRSIKGELDASSGLPATERGSGAPPVTARGWLTYGKVRADLDGRVNDLLSRRNIQGTVTVQGPSLGLLGELIGVPFPTTSPFSLQGKIEKTADIWHVDVEKARIGTSHLSARVTYDPGPTPPRLEGELGGSNLVLADLGPAFGTRNAEGIPMTPRPGRIFPNRPLDLPSLKNLDARITIDLERIDLGRAFKEPIQPFKAVLTLNSGQLGLARVDARTARGRMSGEISVDGRQQQPVWRSNLAWEDIHLGDWLKSAKARRNGTDGSRGPPYFTGILQGRARLIGEGRSTAELLASLDGEITLSVRQGTLSHLVVEVLGLDVAQGLGLAMRGDESLPVQCAVVDLQAKNGRISPKVALIDTPVTLVLADGTINLSKESLDVRLIAKPKNVSPLTLRSPIRVQGSLVDPQTAPEPGPIAARVIGGVALAFVNPLAAILPFIDPGSASESPCSQALSALKH